MKNLKIILAFMMLATFIISCDDDGGTSKIDLQEGGVTNITKNADLDAILNLTDLRNGDELQIGFAVDVFYGNVVSADVVGFYKTSNDLFGPVNLVSGITQFPTEVTLDQDDIIASFAELNGRDDIKLADELIVSTRILLADGSEINLINNDGTRNYGSDIHTSPFFSAQVSYPVSCPSDLGGVYNVVTNGENTDGQPPVVDFPYTVTLTDNGGGNYSISDGVAGVYIEWYSIYGYTFETAGNFTDICGVLSGSWVEGFGCQIDLTGTLNDDGTLTIRWDNCFGDFGDAVYTPQ
ncbi:MAG: hypothetical protein MUP24_12275 [Gillisia sp.]|nr:hypothetical protein [Gillisia sp.]